MLLHYKGDRAQQTRMRTGIRRHYSRSGARRAAISYRFLDDWRNPAPQLCNLSDYENLVWRKPCYQLRFCGRTQLKRIAQRRVCVSRPNISAKRA